MKQGINIKLFLVCILFSATQKIFAQHNPILDNFNLTDNYGKVFLSWTIISGSTCNGIQIYRSTDNISFIKVGDIAGICGSTSSPTNYNFTDENPEKNKTNFYRLELGGNGSSEILSVQIIDIESGGYQIRPNPVLAEAKIYFDNNRKLQNEIFIYNLSGKLVYTSSTKKDFFELNAETFTSGIYLFIISTEENAKKESGKIAIQ